MSRHEKMRKWGWATVSHEGGRRAGPPVIYSRGGGGRVWQGQGQISNTFFPKQKRQLITIAVGHSHNNVVGYVVRYSNVISRYCN